MKLIRLIVLTSFIGIAVFGFVGLTDNQSLFSSCVRATIPGSLPCDGADHNTILSMAFAKQFQSFSSALLVLFAFFLSFNYFNHNNSKLTFAFNALHLDEAEEDFHTGQFKLFTWIINNLSHPNRA